jgi:hypothetical protein
MYITSRAGSYQPSMDQSASFTAPPLQLELNMNAHPTGMVPANLGAPQSVANPPGFVPSNLGALPPAGMVPTNQPGQLSPMIPVSQQMMPPMQGGCLDIRTVSQVDVRDMHII